MTASPYLALSRPSCYRLVVVTSNVGEFARVPELKVEDWMV
jgi:hypothetical protein